MNAKVVNGAGNPWFKADVGVKGDRIGAVGLLSGLDAERIIDAGGLVVARAPKPSSPLLRARCARLIHNLCVREVSPSLAYSL